MIRILLFAIFVGFFLQLNVWAQPTQFIDNYEDGDFTNNPAWSNTTGFNNSTSSPIAGSRSLRLNTTGFTRAKSFQYGTSTNFSGATQVWRFVYRDNALLLPSGFLGLNALEIWLAANNTSFNNTTSGYKIDYTSARIRLMAVDNGNATELTNNGFDVSLNTQYMVRVVRTAAGQWQLFMDAYSAGAEATTLRGQQNHTNFFHSGSSNLFFAVRGVTSILNGDRFVLDNVEYLRAQVTLTALNNEVANGLTPRVMSGGNTNRVPIGFSITTNTQIQLNSLQIAVSAGLNSNWTNGRLMEATTTNYTTASLTNIGGSFAFNQPIAITGLTRNIPMGTRHYFMVVDVAANLNNPAPINFSLTINQNNWGFSPSVTVENNSFNRNGLSFANTYFWRNTNTNGGWENAGSWNPNRNSQHSNDILIFDNIGTVEANNIPSGRTIGQLIIRNSSVVRLTPQNNNTDLTISGLGEEGLNVSANSNLRLVAANALRIALSNTATGNVYGEVTFSGQNRLGAANTGSLQYHSGAIARLLSTTNSWATPFSASGGQTRATLFKEGSAVIDETNHTVDIHSWNGSQNKAGFEDDGWVIKTGAGQLYWDGGRNFSCVRINNPSVNFTSNGSTDITLKHLVIENCTQLAFANTHANINITGDITVHQGSLMINSTNLTFSGNGAQKIQGNGGTISLNSPQLNILNGVNVEVSRDINSSSALILEGTLTLTGGHITLSGTTSGNGLFVGSTDAILTIGGTSGGSFGYLNFAQANDNSRTLRQLNINRTGANSTVTLNSMLSLGGGSNAQLNLQNGTLNLPPAATLVFQNASNPLVRANGNLNSTGGSIQWGTNAAPFNNAISLPDGLFGSASSFGNFELNTNASLNLGNQDFTVLGTLQLNAGLLNTGANKIILGPTGSLNTETNTARLIGAIETTRLVGYGSSTFGGIGYEIATGPEDLGIITLTRYSGASNFKATSTGTSIARYFDVQMLGGEQPVSGRLITMRWLSAEDNSKNFSGGIARAYRKEGPTSDWTLLLDQNDVAGLAITNTGNQRAVTARTTHFSEYTVTDGDNPLPITMKAFMGKCTQQGNQIIWVTGEEKENKGFTIERSFDGDKFEKISYLAGKGNTTSGHSYQFTKNEKLSATVYYRLIQEDFNGERTIYGPIKVSSDCSELNSAQIHIFPQPAVNELFVKLSGNPLEVGNFRVISAEGKLVLKGEIIASSTNSISVESLPKGVYSLEIEGIAERKVFLNQ